jgi:uncharacterized protein with NRDE domain
MCLILLALGQDRRYPLILLANRDEFHARPSLPAAPWPEDARVLGGRDLAAGGTWLACRSDGRFAAVANFRKKGAPAGRRSRGELPMRFVLGDEPPAAFLAWLEPRIADYAPFNLLLGAGTEVWWLQSEGPKEGRFGPGIHAISNGPIGASWPKCRRAAAALAELLAQGEPEEDALLKLLAERTPAADAELPDTGLPIERERLLSPIFIAGAEYGTRASSLFTFGPEVGVRFIECRFAAGGKPEGASRWLGVGDAWRSDPLAA